MLDGEDVVVCQPTKYGRCNVGYSYIRFVSSRVSLYDGLSEQIGSQSYSCVWRPRQTLSDVSGLSQNWRDFPHVLPLGSQDDAILQFCNLMQWWTVDEDLYGLARERWRWRTTVRVYSIKMKKETASVLYPLCCTCLFVWQTSIWSWRAFLSSWPHCGWYE